jgi:hypothetical protein
MGEDEVLAAAAVEVGTRTEVGWDEAEAMVVVEVGWDEAEAVVVVVVETQTKEDQGQEERGNMYPWPGRFSLIAKSLFFQSRGRQCNLLKRKLGSNTSPKLPLISMVKALRGTF